MEEERDHSQDEQALVFLEAWGSGETLDEEPFQGHAYVISDYAPDWVELPEQYADKGGVVSLLTVTVGDPTQFEGYTVVGRYGIGQQECPYTGVDGHDDQCTLCEGSPLYWGEEWQLVVLVPVEEGDDA